MYFVCSNTGVNISAPVTQYVTFLQGIIPSETCILKAQMDPAHVLLS